MKIHRIHVNLYFILAAYTIIVYTRTLLFIIIKKIEMIEYIKGFPSPDGKYVYVIGNIMANSTEWTNNFIVYQVNTSTFKVEYLNAVAAWKLEDSGFTVASQTRCTTPKATSSVEMDFAFEDITYGFDGKVKHRSKEYPSKEIKNRYKDSDHSEIYP